MNRPRGASPRTRDEPPRRGGGASDRQPRAPAVVGRRLVPSAVQAGSTGNTSQVDQGALRIDGSVDPVGSVAVSSAWRPLCTRSGERAEPLSEPCARSVVARRRSATTASRAIGSRVTGRFRAAADRNRGQRRRSRGTRLEMTGRAARRRAIEAKRPWRRESSVPLRAFVARWYGPCCRCRERFDESIAPRCREPLELSVTARPVC